MYVANPSFASHGPQCCVAPAFLPAPRKPQLNGVGSAGIRIPADRRARTRRRPGPRATLEDHVGTCALPVPCGYSDESSVDEATRLGVAPRSRFSFTCF